VTEFVRMQRVIPESVLTPARIHRVIVHWTAGGYAVNHVDREHYHMVLQDQQRLGRGTDVLAVRGVHAPAANDVTRDRVYAAHTRDLNTGSYGLAAACMLDAEPGGPYGPAPLTRLLWERLAQAAAEVCHRYGLEVTERTVLQHGEVAAIYGLPQGGKWDCLELPFDRALSRAEVAAQFRRKVSWYLHRLRSERDA